jgi:ligand-binding sensor domain-containing protein/putative methionine-R-sulfoxide reductase with GAF domain/two-component sensor histidine kinase
MAATVLSIAQDLSFFHLSKKEGLSDNQVSDVLIDKTGLLWIGTAEGLNCYDGYRVKRFYKEEYPELQNNNILRMVCDERNRLWIHFADKQIAMLDEDRRFHSISITDKGQKVDFDYMLPYTSRGILLLSGSRLYTPDPNDPLQMKRVAWQEDSLMRHVFVRINTWDENKVIFSGDSLLFLFDIPNLKIQYPMTIPGVVAAVKLNDQEALITTNDNRKLCRLHLLKQQVTRVYGSTKDQFGNEMHIYPRSIYHLRDHEFIITSAYAGVYIFDAVRESLQRFKHDPANNRSISANNTNFLFSDTSGYFFITTNTNGLNYFNIHHYLARLQPSFHDDRTGKIFDGYVNCINQSRDGHIWLGTHHALIKWNRQNHSAQFRSYGMVNGQVLNGTEEINAICFDKMNRLWIGCGRMGVVVMNEKREVIRYLNTSQPNSLLPHNMITDIKEAPNGAIWITTLRGLCIVDPKTFSITPVKSIPFLERLNKRYCQSIWFRNDKEAWVGVKGAAYKIDLVTNNWERFNDSSGLISNDVVCFTDDKAGRIYIGTRGGLHIMEHGKIIRTYNRSNGLRSNRVEGLLRDNNGRIWIGNDNSLVCYDPQNGHFMAYDEGVGLSDAGFRSNSFFKSADGEFFWGSETGVSYFYPQQLQQLQLPLRVNIHTVITTDSTYWLPRSQQIQLPFSKNTISFAFSAIDLYSSNNILYKYKLEGADQHWRTTQTLNEVLYSKLSSGQYRFRVMASKDGQRWIEEQNTIHFEIATPWWRSGWFIVLSTAVVLTGIVYISHQHNNKIRQQQEQIETEQAINYFASSIYEQTSTDNILWDIARNCIGRLNFEDCVIYLKDDNRDVMVQKAAWGPKTTGGNNIINPLEIPFGRGIVGHVAATGTAEIIADTSKDSRYIVDDVQRFSEITVPIIYNGHVLGIIDSEHRKPNFFTGKHLSILTAIASLCAHKIMRVKAEEATRQANLEKIEHQRKSVEAQLKSLRLQMSPHFLFNSLNSIQQMILTGDANAATLYLSKFSRLLRLVLSHSDKEKVTLKEELETLSLYIELESLRFKDTFQFEIICDESVDKDETTIPTLLIQPFVENAIWHGLLHKEGLRSLTVKFAEDSFENLVCIVEDNGIGREAARHIHRKNHSGKGIAVAEERLRTYNVQHAVKSQVFIEDLKDIRGLATGTRVIVTLPLLN